MRPSDDDSHDSDEKQPQLELGTHLSAGARAYQHDRVITHLTHLSSANPMVAAAVFDGHGSDDLGHIVSAHCEDNLLTLLRTKRVWQHLEAANAKALTHALEDVVEALEEDSLALNDEAQSYVGSTLCGVLLSTEMLASVNVGDSRAVLATRTTDGSLSATDLTRDHVVTSADEHARVISNGGWVERGSVNGYISMTRALGDADLKAHRNLTEFPRKPPGREFGARLFTAEPDIAFFKRDHAQRFVIVATDGVWATVSSETAVKIVDASLRSGAEAQKAASILCRRAVSAGSADNCSAAVVVLERGLKEYESRWGRLGKKKIALGLKKMLRRNRAPEPIMDETLHGGHAFQRGF